MLQLMLNFDAIFEEVEATDVIAIVVTMMFLLIQAMMTALGNQKMALANHVAESIVAMILLVNLVTMMLT